MSVPRTVYDQVRVRANYACEYCGVRESDSGGELTVDHYRPKAFGGDDSLDNLVYCCFRCNAYKADYSAESTDDIPLWNPRKESRRQHFLVLSDGFLFPHNPIADFTLSRLRLNRPQLVELRLAKGRENDHHRHAAEVRELSASLRMLHDEHLELVDVQRQLLRRLEELLGE